MNGVLETSLLLQSIKTISYDSRPVAAEFSPYSREADILTILWEAGEVLSYPI